jgi:hypothetical protein
MEKETKKTNTFKAIQAIAKGIEKNLKGLFKPLRVETNVLVKAGESNAAIIASLEKFPVCKKTVKNWLTLDKPKDERRGGGGKSKAATGADAGADAAKDAKASGLPRGEQIVLALAATFAKPIGEQIDNATTLADAEAIAKQSGLFRLALESIGEPVETSGEPSAEAMAKIDAEAKADAKKRNGKREAKRETAKA